MAKKEKESKLAKLSDDERCSIAEELSDEEWFAVCGKEKAFCKVAALLGVDNPEELLDKCDVVIKEFEEKGNRKDICSDFSKVRSVVMCVAWDKMETGEYSFKDATKEAWDEIKQSCKEIGKEV